MRSLVTVCLASLFVSLVAFGQTTPPPNGFGSTALKADLSPLNVVPPVQDRTASGTADVEITLIQTVTGGAESAVVSFEISLVNAQAGAVTGFAIHEGVAGENGPVVVEAQLNSDTQTPGSTINGQVLVADPTLLEALQAILQSPETFYVLLTATDNPTGLLRGQLSDGGDMGEEMDNLSDKIDRIREQLDTIQRMVRSVGRVLGIDPQFLPEPAGDTTTNGNGGEAAAASNP